MMNNTRPFCITAAAGTELAGATSISNHNYPPLKEALQPKSLHPPRNIAGSNFRSLSNIPHCCLLKSLGRVSVPVWLIILSDQLKIFGLVSNYLTNYLILRRFILWRKKSLVIWYFRLS